MITKSQAQAHRGNFHHVTKRNADGTPMRARPSGQCKTWKTRPAEFCLPVKRGMYDSGYITHDTANQWCTSAEEAMKGVS